ncbi:MAG: hypothetical protein IMW92_09765 [Bacillales bacterium]|nr:hypothetical protein [Bacillales bacterium]
MPALEAGAAAFLVAWAQDSFAIKGSDCCFLPSGMKYSFVRSDHTKVLDVATESADSIKSKEKSGY